MVCLHNHLFSPNLIIAALASIKIKIHVLPRSGNKICADPESSAREGPSLTYFFLSNEVREDPNSGKSGPSSARQ